MKAVQIGILAALLLCAGLLYRISRGQQRAAVATQAAAAQAVPTPAPLPAPGVAAPPAAVALPAPTPLRRRPAPSRSVLKKTEVAENRVPDPAPAPAAPAPAVPANPPAEAAPTPAPRPVVALNPPPETETAPPEPRQPQRVAIPAGTLITVRLTETVSSERNRPGDAFAATVDQPLVVDGFVIAERGAPVQGKVLQVERAGRVQGVAQIAVQLTRLHTSDGQDVAISTERFAREGPNSHREDAAKVGAGAALGAIIGAIAGGGKGAAIGAGVGGAAGAGTVAATRGKPAELPVETRLTFRLREPITLTERTQ